MVGKQYTKARNQVKVGPMKKAAAKTPPKKKTPLVSKGVRRKPVEPPARLPKNMKRPKEKPVKKTALTKQEEALLLGEDTIEEIAKEITPDEAAAFLFLQAYLKTLNINSAAAMVLNEEDRQSPAKVRSLAKRMWKSPVFQSMLDEHLEEFGKKTRRLKRLVHVRLQQEMAANDGVGSHQARVRAAEALGKFLGMDQKPEKEKSVPAGTGVLVIPGIMSLDDWSKAAEKAQEQLRKKTEKANQG